MVQGYITGIDSVCLPRLSAPLVTGQLLARTSTRRHRMLGHPVDLYVHVSRLRMYDHLACVRIHNELPPPDEVERALWSAIDEHWWNEQVSESFRVVMRAITERAINQGHEMATYEAIRFFNRSHIDRINEARRRSTPGRYYVHDKLEWISHKLVRKIEQDWKLVICLIKQLHYGTAPGQYAKLVVETLRNHTVAGGRSNSEPRIRKKQKRRARSLSEDR